ncbi:hypothetical protein ACOMHN_002798 [Nucella lapillus]
MLSRFERGRLPVAARLPALLWIVFFYSLNNLKMVDFRGFKHSDVPKEGRGSGNKHRGVQKSKRLGLNIPKKADFRGFKHSDVLEGSREGVNKHRGVQKSKRNFLSRFERGWLPVAARLPALLWIVFSTASTYPKWSIFGVSRGQGRWEQASGSPKKHTSGVGA